MRYLAALLLLLSVSPSLQAGVVGNAAGFGATINQTAPDTTTFLDSDPANGVGVGSVGTTGLHRIVNTVTDPPVSNPAEIVPAGSNQSGVQFQWDDNGASTTNNFRWTVTTNFNVELVTFRFRRVGSTASFPDPQFSAAQPAPPAGFAAAITGTPGDNIDGQLLTFRVIGGGTLAPGTFDFDFDIDVPESFGGGGTLVMQAANPEPGSMALCGLAIGMIGGGTWWRRRRKAAADEKESELEMPAA